jgi:nucleotide-binding universal stress UspA family protein
MMSDSAGGTRIVAGVDGSPSSIHALRWAWRQAHATGAALTVVTAWHSAAVYGEGSPLGAYAVVGFPVVDWEEAARSQLEHTLRDTLGEDGYRGVARVVSRGYPAAVLIEAATDADLLVVGSHGHGGFIGTLLGSVSLHLAHHAPCPLTIIPAPREHPHPAPIQQKSGYLPLSAFVH